MNNPIVFITPSINVLVTALFAGVVLSQYLKRHRLYQLYWAIALIMAFLATLAYVLMIVAHPTSDNGLLFFHAYYVLGVLMPAWLGMGSIALISSPRVTYITLTALYILSLLTTALTLLARVDMHKLSQIAGSLGSPGTGILQPGPWLAAVITLNTLGVVAVVGVAIYSGWKLVRSQSSIAGFRTSNLLQANVLILVGDLINAAAGSLARFLGVEGTFWLTMALGWIVFFTGVLLTSRRSSATKPIVSNKDFEDVEKRVVSS